MEVTSKAVLTRVVGDGLLRLKRQFEQWRAGRKARQRIPSQLWSGAVATATEHGVYRVAAKLHLDYAVLKRRVALAAGTRPAPEVAPRFVELFAPAGPTPAAAASLHPACVVELDNARGAKMRVEFSGKALAGAGVAS